MTDSCRCARPGRSRRRRSASASAPSARIPAATQRIFPYPVPGAITMTTSSCTAAATVVVASRGSANEPLEPRPHSNRSVAFFPFRSSYSCSCFEGLKDEDCGSGPLCGGHGNNNFCKNGGICKYVRAIIGPITMCTRRNPSVAPSPCPVPLTVERKVTSIHY